MFITPPRAAGTRGRGVRQSATTEPETRPASPFEKKTTAPAGRDCGPPTTTPSTAPCQLRRRRRVFSARTPRARRPARSATRTRPRRSPAVSKYRSLEYSSRATAGDRARDPLVPAALPARKRDLVPGLGRMHFPASTRTAGSSIQRHFVDDHGDPPGRPAVDLQTFESEFPRQATSTSSPTCGSSNLDLYSCL